MTPRERLVRNTAWYGAVTVLGLGAGLVTSVLLARGLGPSRLGEYSFLLFVMRTLSAFATLGFALGAVRYTAESLARDDRALAASYVRILCRRQALATTGVVLAAAPVVLWTAPPDMVGAYLVLLLTLFPDTRETVYIAVLYGAQRYDLTSLNSTLKMTLQLAGTALVVALGLDVTALAVAIALPTLCSWALQRRRVRRLLPLDEARAVPPGARLELRRYLAPLSAVAVLETLVWDRSELIFLRLHASSEDIAYYSLAFGLAVRAMVLPEIVSGALLPTLATLHGRGEHAEFAHVYRAALRYVALVGAPIAALGIALAPGLITLLYGTAYLPVAPLLGVLAAVAVLGAMRKVAWAALRAVGDRRAALGAMLVSAGLNLALAALLIPGLGTRGAVIANTAAQVLATAWGIGALARTPHGRFPLADVARIACAALVTWAVAAIVAEGSAEPPRLAAAGLAGMAAFVAVAVVSGALGSREWAFLRTRTRRLLAPRASGV